MTRGTSRSGEERGRSDSVRRHIVPSCAMCAMARDVWGMARGARVEFDSRARLFYSSVVCVCVIYIACVSWGA